MALLGGSGVLEVDTAPGGCGGSNPAGLRGWTLTGRPGSNTTPLSLSSRCGGSDLNPLKRRSLLRHPDSLVVRWAGTGSLGGPRDTETVPVQICLCLSSEFNDVAT